MIVASRNPDLGARAWPPSLHDHGFDVAMIEGGISAWKVAGHPLVKADDGLDHGLTPGSAG